VPVCRLFLFELARFAAVLVSVCPASPLPQAPARARLSRLCHFPLQARRSVSDSDLAKYSSFAASMHQARANLGGGMGVSNFRFPGGGGGGGSAAAAGAWAAGAEDEGEDLYSLYS
jgi:hypothetical protein